jgi:hypothetical protein
MLFSRVSNFNPAGGLIVALQHPTGVGWTALMLKRILSNKKDKLIKVVYKLQILKRSGFLAG